MSRIRSVHPGLFTDEAFMTLTVEMPLACTLLIGLWVEADDSGTFEWKPLTIKARVLPAVAQDVKWLLEALVNSNMVRRFEIDGKPYGVIRNFVKYQRPKDPKDIHPYSEETRAYAGFEANGSRPRSHTGRPPSESNSEPLPKPPGSPSEKARQREDGGGRGKRESSGSNEPEHRASASSFDRLFDRFWEIWPHQVGEKGARTALAHALHDVPIEPILEGVKRYVETKPNDQNWMTPANWLLAERWKDRPAKAGAGGSVTPITDDRVLIPEGSPELAAWAAHYGKAPLTYDTEQRDKHGRRIRGRYEATRWPPGHDPPAEAQHDAA